MNGVTVLADDLSGAAESASAFLGRALPVTVGLSAEQPQPPGAVTVVDLNTRSGSADAARAALRRALTGMHDGAVLVKKIDSMLRGHIGAEVEVLARRGPVVVVAALPVMRRTVRDGILHLDGVPLHRAGAWVAEDRREPRSVAEVFGRTPTEVIAAGAGREARLHAALAGERIAICDAAVDADLDAIVRAAATFPGAQLVGTAALAAAVARTIPRARGTAPDRRPSSRVLVVVGTAEPSAAEQADRLRAAGVERVELDVDELLACAAEPGRTRRALERGHVVVTLRGALDPSRRRAVSPALARYVAAAAAQRPDLVLTGGETARAVVDELGVRSLRPVGQVHHGAVVSLTDDDRAVVTRPGSYGPADSLLQIVDHLAAPAPAHPQAPQQHPQQKDRL